METENTENVRETATIDDSSDDPADWTVQPPQLRVEGDVHEGIIDAVVAAINDHPNAVDAPALWSPEEAPRDVGDHCVAVLTARPNELPATNENGEPVGWLPPYRARERISAVVVDTLGSELNFEALDKTSWGFYR